METQYKGYVIHINQVPEAQFEFSVGFGWGFQVRESNNNALVFRVIVKSIASENTKDNLDAVRELGLTETRSLVDGGWEAEEYCYSWEIAEGLKTVDCDDITPAQFRSPKI